MRIDVSQILVSKPILDAVNSIQSEFNGTIVGLKMDPNPAPFPLKRIDQYNPTIIDSVLEKNPIIVSFVLEINGKSYYTIEDGRHRYAQALAIGLSTIKVRLV